jgi:hypothetical protein
MPGTFISCGRIRSMNWLAETSRSLRFSGKSRSGRWRWSGCCRHPDRVGKRRDRRVRRDDFGHRQVFFTMSL